MIDKTALTEDILMVAAFVAAVDGCALYTLKRTSHGSSTRLFWALIIILLPIVGALSFFFLRPRDPIKPMATEEFETEPCSSNSVSMSPNHTPTVLKQVAMEPLKTPANDSPSANYLYAPTS